MTIVWNMMCLTLRAILRDRILHALLGVAVLLMALVPVLSLFSMRQVQELSITLSLGTISLVLLILAVLLGASSIWRDIERRYTASVLGLPISRSSYLVGKFCGVALFLMACAVVLGLASAAAITIASAQYPSQLPILWTHIAAAVAATGLKYVLLCAFAFLLSALSTSFFLPIFGTLSIYLAGSASQQVIEYLSGDYGKQVSGVAKGVIHGLYYLLPNFSAFDLQVQAIYDLPLSGSGLLLTFLYFAVYTAILLSLAVWVFSRRELP